MDELLFRAINNLAGNWPFLDGLGVFFASALILLMYVGLFVLFLARSTLREQVHEFATVIIAVFASVFAYVFNWLVSLIYFRARPFADLLDVTQLIAKEATEKSFPSDHAALAFAVAVSVFLAHRGWGMVFLAAAVLVVLGRVFVGVHFPGDVLAGAIVGGLWALLVCHYGRSTIERLLNPKS